MDFLRPAVVVILLLASACSAPSPTEVAPSHGLAHQMTVFSQQLKADPSQRTKADEACLVHAQQDDRGSGLPMLALLIQDPAIPKEARPRLMCERLVAATIEGRIVSADWQALESLKAAPEQRRRLASIIAGES